MQPVPVFAAEFVWNTLAIDREIRPRRLSETVRGSRQVPMRRMPAAFFFFFFASDFMEVLKVSFGANRLPMGDGPPVTFTSLLIPERLRQRS